MPLVPDSNHSSAGLITSVFGRTGVVVAAANDYALADIAGAVAAVGGVPWSVVTKLADESVASSTVLQADDELFFALVNLAVYEVEAVIIYGSPAGGGTPDIKCAFGEDGTSRGAMGGASISSADSGQITAVGTNQSSSLTMGTDALNRAVSARGTHTSAGGTFRMLWAQSNSGVNATIVRAGSVLRYRRLL